MLVAISKLTILTQNTLLYNFKIQFGKGIGLFIIVALMLTVISSIMGVMGVMTEAVQEWSKPLMKDNIGVHPIWSALIFIALLYYLFWTGKHNLF